MAVTTTPRQVIEAAYAKSTKNSPGAIATEAAELLNLVNRLVRKYYTAAAEVNPIYFSTSTDKTPPGAGQPWPRPEGAEAVFRIEDQTQEGGAVEVIVVPYNDRQAEPGTPAVYRMGKGYYSAGNAGDPDPTAITLTFFYSKRPTAAATLDSTLDPTWEEQFNDLLIVEIAIYLAIKDGRADEYEGLFQERADWVRMFASFLQHETVNERRRYGHTRRFASESLASFSNLMAAPGGAP